MFAQWILGSDPSVSRGGPGGQRYRNTYTRQPRSDVRNDASTTATARDRHRVQFEHDSDYSWTTAQFQRDDLPQGLIMAIYASRLVRRQYELGFFSKHISTTAQINKPIFLASVYTINYITQEYRKNKQVFGRESYLQFQA